MSIDLIINDLIKREGGYVNNPNDHGGATKFGITLNTLKDWRKSVTTIADVAELWVDEAREIYKELYYLKPKLDTLPELVQDQILDIAIHSGPVQAVKLLQSAISNSGWPLAEDGVIGPRTLRGAENMCFELGERMNHNIAVLREQFLRNLVENDPSQQEFLVGWVNRARRFRIYESN